MPSRNSSLMSPDKSPPPIRKAIFPIAGIGSRFLPLTLAVPKEMIPIIDTPLLHYAVAEALEAGIEECIFIIAPQRDQRRVIEEYFCDNGALERRLHSAGKGDQTARWRALLPRPKRVLFVEQERPLGLGHAIWLARERMGEESFAVLLPDELLISRPGCLASLTAANAASDTGKGNGFLLAMQHVPQEICHRYGILDVGPSSHASARPASSSARALRGERGETSPRKNARGAGGDLPPKKAETALGTTPVDILGVVEKPVPETAPSCLAIIGRYILPPTIFPLLAPKGRLHNGEDTPLTDALAALIAQGVPARGLLFDGERYDCGDKGGFLAATLSQARKRPELAGMLQEMLQEMLP